MRLIFTILLLVSAAASYAQTQDKCDPVITGPFKASLAQAGATSDFRKLYENAGLPRLGLIGKACTPEAMAQVFEEAGWVNVRITDFKNRPGVWDFKVVANYRRKSFLSWLADRNTAKGEVVFLENEITRTHIGIIK